MTSRLALVPAARTVRRRDAATGVPVPVFGMLAVVVGARVWPPSQAELCRRGLRPRPAWSPEPEHTHG